MITQSAKKDDLLLDMFVGSGTFLEAAYEVGLNFIGFERDEKWFNVANERIQSVMAQTRLF